MDEGGKRKRLSEQVSDLDLPPKRARSVSSDFDAQQMRHAFIGSFKMMVDDLSCEELIPRCISCEILSPQEADEVIRFEPKTTQAKNYRLLCTIHRKASADPGVLALFKGVLEEMNAETGASGCLEHIIRGLCSRRPAPTCSSESEDYGHLQSVLQTMYTTICSSVDAAHILPELISRKVVTVEQSEEVISGSTSERRTASLLNMLRYCDRAKLRAVFEVLQNSNQIPPMLQVADLLKQPPQQALCKFFTVWGGYRTVTPHLMHECVCLM